jgi:hypothetical protein
MGVMTNTDPAMAWNANRLRKGMFEEDEKAKRAAEQVRARRAAQGLRVSRKKGEELPETKANREQYEREMKDANPLGVHVRLVSVATIHAARAPRVQRRLRVLPPGPRRRLARRPRSGDAHDHHQGDVHADAR